MMNNNKFYKIGVAVSVLLIGVIVACIVIAQKQDDKVAKAEDFPSHLLHFLEEQPKIICRNSLLCHL